MTVRAILFCWLLWTVPAQAERITVAVASNFLTTVQDVAAAFEAQTGHEVVLVHGSTGKLYAQIVNGAPFDLFLSADTERPKRLVDAGLVAQEHVLPYAIGRLALVHRKRVEPGELDSLLLQPGLRIAIADPAVAPYGLAASEVLRNRLGDDWADNVVYGESVGQAFAFVATGNADLGLVALSQVNRFEGELWSLALPDAMHAPIQQDAVLLAKSVEVHGARAFFEFLISPLARQIIADAGYEVPQ